MTNLKEIKGQYFEIVNERKMGGKFRQILVCGGSGCTSNHSKEILDRFTELCKNDKDIKIVSPGCFGLCAKGPSAVIYPEGAFYETLTVEKVDEIYESHIKNGKVLEKYVYNIQDGKLIDVFEMPFFKKQMRLALRNCGITCPAKIQEYIAKDGYFALEKCLKELTPDQVIEIITNSGLRGRGGAGFPTGKKWSLAKASENKPKFVCCNADEGDPGAFMDRAILESDPNSVVEAMTIAGYAIGANQGYIYVRAEYPLAIKSLETAIKQANELNLLGNNILGTDFSFNIELRFGAGAFVCGEETALMTSIEGKRGEPHPRPPYPAVKGLFNQPTLLNNVETYANIPQIILKGADWFNKIGTEKSKGTKVFSIGGKITNTGLVEVPMGITLKEVVEEIGGGVLNGKQFKAVQTGGPSGGCIPKKYEDLQIDYDNLVAIGSMMGSGGMIVMDEDTCMVDIAKFFMSFMVEESCGKCTPCRIGTKRMYEILDKITKGTATIEDIEKLKELCIQIKQNSLCGLGQSAPNPTLSTLEHFADEYMEHIKNKRCPAGVCQSLKKYRIDPEKCKGCSACSRVCPVGAISGEIGKKFVIDEAKCIKCGACYKTCRFNAITK